ncbi:unnamed protein product [Effrenium voratum]|nr:unnamed protein product [Effrenium voratum]
MKQSTETRGGSDVSASKVADESMDPGAAMKQFIGNRRSEAQNVKVNIADLNLPPEAKEAFDVDGDGQVDIAEIIAYVNKHKALKKTYNFVTKAFFLTVVMMIFFLSSALPQQSWPSKSPRR